MIMFITILLLTWLVACGHDVVCFRYCCCCCRCCFIIITVNWVHVLLSFSPSSSSSSFLLLRHFFNCRFTSTETVRTIRDGILDTRNKGVKNRLLTSDLFWCNEWREGNCSPDMSALWSVVALKVFNEGDEQTGKAISFNFKQRIRQGSSVGSGGCGDGLLCVSRSVSDFTCSQNNFQYKLRCSYSGCWCL